MRDSISRLAVTCGLVLLAFQGLAVAQMPPPNLQPLVKISITFDSQTLSRDKPAIVNITVENISGKEIELASTCSFDLHSLNKEAVARKHARIGDSYWSPVNLPAGTPTELNIIDPEKLKQGIVVGRVPRVALKFAKDETKTFKMDLTTTFWNASMSSIWPHENLFEVVPKGSYSLSLRLQNRGVNAISNAIEVSVN